MAARLPVRLIARNIGSYGRRDFSSTGRLSEAHNFTMPAMSPTMTEGNISSWKVKEGDSFAAGDILLEIETDKASMDVEAQEDGMMAKIFQGDGSKAVKVGTRIAVLADPGDDVASLEIPADESKPVDSPAENVAKAQKETGEKEPVIKGTPEDKRSSRERPMTSQTGPGQNPKYPLYPSVSVLIHQNHIPDGDVQKIPATGPGGRLLKGDVLAYLGSIDAEYSKEQSERIEQSGHLDLSNIKIAPSQPKPTTAAAADTAASTPKMAPETSVSITISLAEVLKTQQRIKEKLGVTLPLSTFLARAVDFANDDLPKSKNQTPTQDELFNAVLGLDSVVSSTTSRGTYLPQIDAFPSTPSKAFSSSTSRSVSRITSTKPDIMDILSGKVRPSSRPSASKPTAGGINNSTSGKSVTTVGASNTFTLTVPQGEEKRARTFLERMKTILQVEPGRLVL